MSVKKLCRTLTLEEFEERIEEEHQGYRDTFNNKIYFCPNDLGFKLTQAQCIAGNDKCKKCWEYAKEKFSQNN